MWPDEELRFCERGSVMAEEYDKSTPHHEDDKHDTRIDYLKRAVAANEEGDSLLSMYLYLAAFEQATGANSVPSEDAITGLKQAWALACANKERSMAEYIFDLLEPYLSAEETALCTQELQNLALDKLEEFGLSREELEDMANMISEDLMGMDMGLDSPIVKIEHLVSPEHPLKIFGGGFQRIKKDAEKATSATDALASATGEDDGTSGSLSTLDPAKALPSKTTSAKDSEAASKTTEGAGTASSKEDNADDAVESPADFLETAEADLQAFLGAEEVMNYDTLAGYDSAIETMRDFGIGMGNNKEFCEFVDMLNARHGLTKMPALDTLVLRSPAREDANRFMMATLGELSLPTIHMRMEENYQGMPVLCVSAQSVDIPKSNSLRDVFAKGGVLVLEDLDLWSSPVADLGDEGNAFLMMQLTRGAREAVNLISSAVANPDVYVIVTTSTRGTIDPFFLDMLEPMSVIEIDYPTPEERVQIWMDISQSHPSINNISKADLVRLSANMPRFDIYMAAREAIEEAYKLGLLTRSYQAVTRDNLFDKLAAYQPLESEEYTELEDAVISDFRLDLSHLEDLLNED